VTPVFTSEPDATPEEAAAIAAVLAAAESIEPGDVSRPQMPAWRRAALREGIERNADARGTQT